MPEPMVLGYLTSQYGRVSDTFIRQEVRQLRRLGHTVVTFSIRRPGRDNTVGEDVRAEQAGTEYILEAGPVKLASAVLACVVYHPIRLAQAMALAWRTCAPGLRAILWQAFYLIEAIYLARRIEYLRVEHVHNHILNSASVCMLAAVLSGVTWSMTVHGPGDFLGPSGWALSEKLASAEFSVFISEFVRSQAMWLAPPSLWHKLHIVRCGLDETFLGLAPTSVPRAPQLVFVGRLSPEKGVMVLVQAAAKLMRNGVRVELVLVGDGPLRPDIEEEIARHRIGDSVRLLGWLGSDQVRDEILGSRALVLPSFAEGLPIVLMEALALHRPVVSTFVGGIPELVQPGINGFLVAAGSVDDLADAIRATIEKSVDDLAEMGRRGAARVADRHDAARNATQLEGLVWQAVYSSRQKSSVGRSRRQSTE